MTFVGQFLSLWGALFQACVRGLLRKFSVMEWVLICFASEN